MEEDEVEEREVLLGHRRFCQTEMSIVKQEKVGTISLSIVVPKGICPGRSCRTLGCAGRLITFASYQNTATNIDVPHFLLCPPSYRRVGVLQSRTHSPRVAALGVTPRLSSPHLTSPRQLVSSRSAIT